MFKGIGVFYSKTIGDVQAVDSEYSRTGNDLKIEFVSNTKRKISPGDILSFRLTLQNPKLKILRHTRVMTFYPERKNLHKIKLFASYQHDLQCYIPKN